MSKHSLPTAKRSKRVPYQHGEPWAARHKRRQREAIADRDRMTRLLAALEVRISTHNDGAHWKISAGARLFEWWPETGRLIIAKNWDNPRKAHDVDQVVAIIRRWLRTHGRRRP